jgi:hypothetical protein
MTIVRRAMRSTTHVLNNSVQRAIEKTPTVIHDAKDWIEIRVCLFISEFSDFVDTAFLDHFRSIKRNCENAGENNGDIHRHREK